MAMSSLICRDNLVWNKVVNGLTETAIPITISSVIKNVLMSAKENLTCKNYLTNKVTVEKEFNLLYIPDANGQVLLMLRLWTEICLKNVMSSQTFK